jgi:hypothetical protein
MKNTKSISRDDFYKQFEGEIREYAEEEMVEHKDTYFDGYPTINDEVVEEVFQNNLDEFIIEFAKTKGIKIE